MTFDYGRWHDWLAIRVSGLQSNDLQAAFSDNEKHGRSMGAEFEGAFAIASFRNWEHGAMVDYEIVLRSNGDFVANEAGIYVNDENFEAVFTRFLEMFERANR
ncbi:MAG: hypothetical protein JSR60_04650 [Proteobacteria bacterium]|nr:hypothetical protein [Pseudomonadota bacterium]